MTRTVRVVIMLVVFMLLMAAAGCVAPSGREAIYGKWAGQFEGVNYTFDFQSNGIVLIGYNGATLESKYEFVDDDTIKMYPPQGITGEPATFDFRIEGDKFVMIVNGQEQVYERVK